jgi:hypothetical protein
MVKGHVNALTNSLVIRFDECRIEAWKKKHGSSGLALHVFTNPKVE